MILLLGIRIVDSAEGYIIQQTVANAIYLALAWWLRRGLGPKMQRLTQRWAENP